MYDMYDMYDMCDIFLRNPGCCCKLLILLEHTCFLLQLPLVVVNVVSGRHKCHTSVSLQYVS
jgi:hypothetical protein